MVSTVIRQLNLRATPELKSKLKLVGKLSVSQLIGWGTLYYAFSLFLDPLHTTFNWDTSEINLALTFGFVTWAIAAPLVGRALDRYGGRWVMSGGTLLGVIALLTWAQAESLTVLYASWFVMGIAMAAALYEPAFYVLTMAYPRRYKQVITWLTLAGGFASTIFVPLIEYAIQQVGWYHSLIGMAGLNGGIVLPLHWWGLPDHTRKKSRKSNTGTLFDFTLFREDSFKVATFWGLVLWFVLFNSVKTGIIFLFIPLLTKIGTDRETIIFCYSMIGPMQVVGRFILLGFDQNMHSLKIGTIVTWLAPAGILLVAVFPENVTALILFAVLFGTGKGIMTIIRGTVVAEQMDISVYARTNGWLGMFSMISKAATPSLMALLWSSTANTALALGAIGSVGLLAPLGILLVKYDTK